MSTRTDICLDLGPFILFIDRILKLDRIPAMKTFRSKRAIFAIGTIVAASLLMGGCPANNKVENADSALEIATRKVGEEEALKALTAMSLHKPGTGILTWDRRDGDSGNYTFHNVTVTGNTDKKANVDRLVLQGAHLKEEKVAFDRITVYGFSAGDEEKEEKISVRRLELARPSPDLAREIARVFSGGDYTFKSFEGNISLADFTLAELNIAGKDGNVTLEALNVGKAGDATGMFSLKNLHLDSGDKKKIVLNLGSIDVTGVNIDKYKGFFPAYIRSGKNGDKPGKEGINTMFENMNVFDPGFKSASMHNFDIDVDGFTIDFEAIEAKTGVTGDTTTSIQNMTPVTLGWPDNSSEKAMKDFKEVMDALGYDKLVVSGAQKNMLNEKADIVKIADSYFEMHDGFKLSYEYTVSGYAEFIERAASLVTAAGDNANVAVVTQMLETINTHMLETMKLNRLKLAFQDDSIIDRAFSLAAEKQGVTPQALKKQTREILQYLPMMARDEAQQKLATELAASLGALLDNGGTLVIAMNPDTPLDFSTLVNAGSEDFDVSKLGVSITHQ